MIYICSSKQRIVKKWSPSQLWELDLNKFIKFFKPALKDVEVTNQ